MTDRLVEIIRENSLPLSPIPTNVAARHQLLSGIRCVMFDIYGTLVISGSGDVGTADETLFETAFRTSLAQVGIVIPPESPPQSPLLQTAIKAVHAESRAQGVDYPEVEIREVWRRVLNQLANQIDAVDASLTDELVEQLSVHYEMRTNPVWPMPHCGDCLPELKKRGLSLGIISNAQFYTLSLFAALLDRDLDELGFDPNLRVFSFAHRRAKPGLFLYETAKQKLAGHGISPAEVLYVGNDMLKDIYPATQIGFRTALFAGDARSLRLREDDDRTRGLEPDLILTDLAELPNCLAGD